MSLHIQVRKQELGLLFRRGDFVRVLEPGRHLRLLGRFRKEHVTIVDMTQPVFRHRHLEWLVKEPELAARLTVIELADHERAVAYRAGRLLEVFEPGVHALWKGSVDVQVERFDVRSAPRLVHPSATSLAELRPQSFHLVSVANGQLGVIFLDGSLHEELLPGTHVFWRGAHTVTTKVVDLRQRTTDVSGQEIMTKDKVTLRVNLHLGFRAVDAVRTVTESVDAEQALYRSAQLALRAAVGARTLDALLADKELLNEELHRRIAPEAERLGIELGSVGVRDVILPGDMKTILNQVIEAQKAAEANVIRRREETAAARSQANTAKLLAENPVLLRMREMDALQDILAGTNATFVFGAGDLPEQIRKLVPEPDH